MYEQLRDYDWLHKRYVLEMMTVQQIADVIGCNKATVARALKRHGIPARPHTSKFTKLNDKDWLISAYVNDGRSLNDIAAQAGTTAANVASHLETLGISRRSTKEGLKLKFPEGRTLEDHPNWKGGRRITRRGYIWLYAPDHPNATGHGYVQEHRLVAEAALGRLLNSDEIVHHIDGDKSNNVASNLQVMTRADHVRLHFEAVSKLHEANQRIAELENEIHRLKAELAGG
jgi:hypothetical protein